MRFAVIAFVASIVLALVALAAPSRRPAMEAEVRKDTITRVVLHSR